MRIFVSGPMTGYPDLNRPAFCAAVAKLRSEGHFVIDPFDISEQFGSLDDINYSFGILYSVVERHKGDYCMREDFEQQASLARAVMDADLAAVRSCDAIYLLKGWESSRGARKELAEALANNLEIRQEGVAE